MLLHMLLHQILGSGTGYQVDRSFDNIEHEPLLNKLPTFTTTLRRWLKAGVVELGHYSDSEAGTPQGGVASPLLANIALDGMEKLFGAESPDGKLISPALRKGLDKGISLIRYADDFVVTAPTREVLETYVLPRITEFLRERGLNLSEAKTRIVHINDGFDFLGFSIRRYKKRLLTKPQKKKVLRHLQEVKNYLDANKQTPAVTVVRTLNPIIRGWANYYRHSVAKETFNYVRHRQWQMLWQWAKRRHPKKPSKWVKRRYFRNDGYWTFYEGNAELVKPSTTPITRFVKVSGRNSPYNPKLHPYWQERAKRQVSRQTYKKQRLLLLKLQGYSCALCHLPFTATEQIEEHHIMRRTAGGSNDLENLLLVHHWCHHQHHQKIGYKVVKA